MKQVLLLFKRVFDKWQEDECLNMGAAVAYYALFSLFPLMLITLSIVGNLIPENLFRIQNFLDSQFDSPLLSDLVMSTLRSLYETRVSAGFFGTVSLLLVASGFFGALDRAFRIIWGTGRPLFAQASLRQAVRQQVSHQVRRKLVSFLLVFVVASLLMTWIIAGATLSLMRNAASNWFEFNDFVQGWVELGITFGVMTLAFALLFRILPDTDVTFGDVWLGALLSATSFMLVQRFIGYFITTLNYQAYGVIGGVMAIMFYIYVISQVIFIGCEFTCVYAHRYGSRRGSDSAPQALGMLYKSPASERVTRGPGDARVGLRFTVPKSLCQRSTRRTGPLRSIVQTAGRGFMSARLIRTLSQCADGSSVGRRLACLASHRVQGSAFILAFLLLTTRLPSVSRKMRP
ncbi:YihY/virulence factor BrkB family protein [Candidatus Gracilibacteria bacterium]|nr:YihY/virulence factor BrkB family protein [Candidatus Gracilibacteria bacterium]